MIENTIARCTSVSTAGQTKSDTMENTKTELAKEFQHNEPKAVWI